MALIIPHPEHESYLFGVISDTHARLLPDVLEALEGVDGILHAGDVGSAQVLTGLEAIAPVWAVRGNVDHAPWALQLPQERVVEVVGRRVLLGHIRGDLTRSGEPAARGMDAVIFGHSHRPLVEWHEGVLYLNPGSAGPRRFGLPRAVALLEIGVPGLDPRIVMLEEG